MTDEQIGFEISKDAALEIALSMYVNRKCPYCGEPMTRKDLDTAIVSDVDADPCHEACWKSHIARRQMIAQLRLRQGMRIKTTKLGETTGMLIEKRHLDARATGITGTIRGWVPGHGGDVWWVQHDGSEDIGAYSVDEMEETAK